MILYFYKQKTHLQKLVFIQLSGCSCFFDFQLVIISQIHSTLRNKLMHQQWLYKELLKPMP